VSTTVADAGVTRRWSRQRLIIGGLIVSVVLNVFFVAGAVWTRLHPPPEWPNAGHRFRELEKALNLEPRQRQDFEIYVATMRARTIRMQQQTWPLMAAAWEEMAKPQSDEAQILRLFDEAAEKRRDFQHDSTTETLKFLSELTPAQRTKFIAITRERRAAWARQANPPR
jgi:Spy/CpxP family protein refolding chaperone